MRKALPLLLAGLIAVTGADAQVKGYLRGAANRAARTTVNTVIDKAQSGKNSSNSDNSNSNSGADAIDPGTPSDNNITAQKNAGKIVFSSDINNLKKDAENTAAFSTSFTLGQPIYFRAYTARPLTANLHQLLPDVNELILGVHGRYTISFTIDNNPPYIGHTQQEAMEREWKDSWTTFKGALQAQDNETYMVQDLFKDFVSTQGEKLSSGAHTVKMDIMPYTDYPEERTGKIVATGTFTLTVNASSVDPNNEKLCMPAAQMNDKEIEAGIFKAFKAKGWKEQAQEVRILSDKWNIERNKNTGIVLRRVIDAVVASTRDGKCISQEFSFAQDYDGSQYQKEIYLYGVGGQRDINCKCIAKLNGNTGSAQKTTTATAAAKPAAGGNEVDVDPRDAFFNVSYKFQGSKMVVVINDNGESIPFVEVTSSTLSADTYKIYKADGKTLIATYTASRKADKITLILNIDKNRKHEFDLTTYLANCRNGDIEKDAVRRKTPVYWLYKNGFAK